MSRESRGASGGVSERLGASRNVSELSLPRCDGLAPHVRGSLPAGSGRSAAGGLEMLPPLLSCLGAPKLPLGGALEAKKALTKPS